MHGVCFAEKPAETGAAVWSSDLLLTEECTPQCADGYVPWVSGVGSNATLNCTAKILYPATFECHLSKGQVKVKSGAGF